MLWGICVFAFGVFLLWHGFRWLERRLWPWVKRPIIDDMDCEGQE